MVTEQLHTSPVVWLGSPGHTLLTVAESETYTTYRTGGQLFMFLSSYPITCFCVVIPVGFPLLTKQFVAISPLAHVSWFYSWCTIVTAQYSSLLVTLFRLVPHQCVCWQIKLTAEPAPVMEPDRPICKECKEEFDDSYLFQNFDHPVCDSCRYRSRLSEKSDGGSGKLQQDTVRNHPVVFCAVTEPDYYIHCNFLVSISNYDTI